VKSRLLFATCLFLVCLLPLSPPRCIEAQDTPDPWTAAQTIQSADLLKELGDGKSAPTILYVGFNRLYNAGHIKGAIYKGSGGTPEGLNGIKMWAGTIAHSTNLVLYCGCCPMEKCPNIRPAYSALKDMGFINLRILFLPHSFAVDWAEKGLPYDKGE
jgi:thiosulfate/3-mercaptopyruvate sulfurtransferase